MDSIVDLKHQTAMNARSVLCSTIAVLSFSSLISIGILLGGLLLRVAAKLVSPTATERQKAAGVKLK